MTPLSLIGIRDSGSGIRGFEVLEAESITLRTATVDDTSAIHELIDEYLSEGHLLPRALGEILVHVDRFVVAVHDDEVVAFAELAPLSRSVAEVRSMVVSRQAR